MGSEVHKRNLTGSETEKSSFFKKQKVNVIVNEEPLKGNVIRYYLMTSLKRMSAAKIVTTLWSRVDIRNEVRTIFDSLPNNNIMYSSELSESYQRVKSKVLDATLEVSRFDVIRKILADFVCPVGDELCDWIMCLRHVSCGDHYPDGQQHTAVKSLVSPVWTSRGLIDYKETARALLAKDELCKGCKYYIACIYCFEDKIKNLAPQALTSLRFATVKRKPMFYFWFSYVLENFVELQEEFKKELSIFNEKYNDTYGAEEVKQDLIRYAAELKKEFFYYNRSRRTNCSMNEYLFQILCEASYYSRAENKVGLKYIWYRLNDEQKSRAVVKAPDADIRCFFLSQMNEEQQQKVFQDNASTILISFLDNWLWKDYFLPTIHHIWNVISGHDYFNALINVVHRIRSNYEDIEKHNRYKAIFKELWKSAPEHLKEYLFKLNGGSDGISIFLDLLDKKNLDIIQLILSDINYIQKKKLIFSSIDSECYDLIIGDQLDLLETVIKYGLFSEEDVDLFKQKLVKCKGRAIAEHFIRNRALDKVERFLQWAFKSEEEIREFKQGFPYS